MKAFTSMRLLAVTTALLACACGPAPEDDKKVPPTQPSFLIHSAVEIDDSRTNYFTLVDSISEEGMLDYANSIEVPGRARLYAATDYGFVVIGDSEALTLTRYEVKDGALVAGGTLSLQAQGVTSLGAQAVIYLSETKAYYKDSGQMQIIVWNPSTMEIEKTIALPETLVKTGLRNSISQWASRDGEAYLTVGWVAPTYDRVEPGTVLISIDPATDTLTETAEPRCRGLSKTALYDGDLYFFSDVINGLGFTIDGEGEDAAGQADCILRINAGEKTFDPDYLGSAHGAFGDNHIGTVVTVSEDGEAWVAVADTTITPSGPGTGYTDWYSAGWSWWHLPLETLDNAQQLPGEPGAYSSFTFVSGSNFFLNTSAADYSKSTFVELSTGTAKDGLSFPGFLLDVAEIR